MVARDAWLLWKVWFPGLLGCGDMVSWEECLEQTADDHHLQCSCS